MHYTWALRHEFGRNSHYFCEKSAGESLWFRNLGGQIPGNAKE